MNTLLQLVLLMSVIVGIIGGCGMELHYMVVTVVLLKLAWTVVGCWRTFQHDRDNNSVHRRLACGAAMILFISAGQIGLMYFVAAQNQHIFNKEAGMALALAGPPRTHLDTFRRPGYATNSQPRQRRLTLNWRSIHAVSEQPLTAWAAELVTE